jgi:hypothetical protein
MTVKCLSGTYLKDWVSNNGDEKVGNACRREGSLFDVRNRHRGLSMPEILDAAARDADC